MCSTWQFLVTPIQDFSFSRFPQAIIKELGLKLIVYDPLSEAIDKWIK